MPDDIASMIEMLLREFDKVEDKEDLYPLLRCGILVDNRYTMQRTHSFLLQERSIF